VIDRSRTNAIVPATTALLPDGNVLMMTSPGIFNLGAEFGSTSVMPNPASLANYPHSAPL
jgi:hypothetical protein